MLASARIPESPGYIETCLRMKGLNAERITTVEQKKTDKAEAKAKKVVKAGMGLRQRRKWV